MNERTIKSTMTHNRKSVAMTPFRYPGGKAFLADYLEDRIGATEAKIGAYAEPYAGGAGAAIELLARGVVEKLVLNDFDRRIYAAWWAILNENAKFIDRVLTTKVNLENWHAAQRIVEENSNTEDIFELGFSTFFLNRTNHSGVILGAGPIGGHQQKGKWCIDARWYPDTMSKRIAWLGEHSNKITLSNLDGLDFLKTFNEAGKRETFFFIDPPYVQAGAKLYMNAMNDLKHKDLARYLTGPEAPPHWLVTYDDCSLISTSYASAKVHKLPVRYSLRRRRIENEICVEPG